MPLARLPPPSGLPAEPVEEIDLERAQALVDFYKETGDAFLTVQTVTGQTTSAAAAERLVGRAADLCGVSLSELFDAVGLTDVRAVEDLRRLVDNADTAPKDRLAAWKMYHRLRDPKRLAASPGAPNAVEASIDAFRRLYTEMKDRGEALDQGPKVIDVTSRGETP